MSNKAKIKTVQMVKCAYCGREDVEITKKGYLKPHVNQNGRQCFGIHIPDKSKIESRKKS